MDYKTLVLFSGGWESVYCLIKAIKKYGNKNVLAVYFHYGAEHQIKEVIAAQIITDRFNVKMNIKRINTLSNKDGVFKGRNTIFITEILKEHISVQRIYFGCRNILSVTDRYGDSNYEYGKVLGKALDITIIMPCIMLPKWYEVKYVNKYLLDANKIIYSTE